MHRFFGKITCWILALLLAGLPYTVLLAQNRVPEVAATCSAMEAGIQDYAVSAFSTAKQLSDESCPCPDRTDCQTSMQLPFSTIPVTGFVARPSGMVQLIYEPVSTYYNRIISPDIKPPKT